MEKPFTVVIIDLNGFPLVPAVRLGIQLVNVQRSFQDSFLQVGNRNRVPGNIPLERVLHPGILFNILRGIPI